MRDIGLQRSARQQLTRPDFSTPAQVVSWLGAVQAQDWAAVKWALGLRLPAGSVTERTIEQAVDDGSIIRTHVMRWTWQLVAPADVRWMLALVGPRLLQRCAGRHRQLELDARTLRKSNAT